MNSSLATDVVVIGQSGQLAKELQKLAPQFKYIGRNQLDLSKPNLISHFFDNNKVKTIVNLAAYTNVETAEENKTEALAVNGSGVGELAKCCDQLIHVSTDFVFNGNQNRPYLESDMTDPINHYGVSKLLGENLAFSANEKTMVLRTSLVYSSFGDNFIEKILHAISAKKKLSYVCDIVGSPTPASGLAQVINSVLKNPVLFKSGVFHYSDEGVCSRYDLAMAVARILKSDSEITPVLASQFSSKAARPAYSVLDKGKIKSELGIKISHWYDNLERFLTSK